MATKIPQKVNKATQALAAVDAISSLAEAKVVLKKIVEHVVLMHQDLKRVKAALNLLNEKVD